MFPAPFHLKRFDASRLLDAAHAFALTVWLQRFWASARMTRPGLILKSTRYGRPQLGVRTEQELGAYPTC
jgi:hypothetical protein